MNGARMLGNVSPGGCGCWLWRRGTDRNGYGTVRFDGRVQFAHRVVYAAMVGPIPDGMTVDHVCFRRSCVNPGHLRLLPRGANARRQRAALSNFCRRGHRMTPGNTYRNPFDGRRRCRTCLRAAAARRTRCAAS